MYKPLIRWTIGDASKEGRECLRVSIANWKRLFGDTFDYAVCFNGSIDLSDLDVTLIDQQEYRDVLPIPPSGPAWKLYPARLRPEAHEIWLDNDLIIHTRPEVVDRFLKGDFVFCTEECERAYGRLEHLAPKRNFNTGFVGFPPYFPLQEKIAQFIKHYQITWEDFFDEQAVVASIIGGDAEMVPLSDIHICKECFEMGRYGVHIIGLNTNTGIEPSYEYWQKNRLVLEGGDYHIIR